jgi:hypothetical protein
MHKFCAAVQGNPFHYPGPPPPCGHEAKWLISLKFNFCFFYGQFKKTLDLQGFWPSKMHLSTKLSTEILDSCGSHDKSMTYVAFPQLG